MDDDFACFDEEAPAEEPVIKEEEVDDDGTSSAAADKMKQLEQQKVDEAKKQADAFLNNMISGNMGSFEPPTKRPRESQEMDTDVEMAEFSQSVSVRTIETGSDNCTHEVAVPPGVQYTPLEKRITEPAKTYPFPLDPFQKEAIACIENSQSVLVSAHTSAGKTVVALYAIAQCLRDKQKVIYTSPIKALSNQKYRELQEEFVDVGLMTGDVTLNPDAGCIVMTTEILRSMLYKGSEMMREVGFVIFDEIHYMRDKERGVVWEETIIMLQHNVHHVFLSATIPNARQFAQWVAWLHSCQCHVVYTDYRPTPLQHFIFPSGGDGLFEVVNVKGEFREDKFNQAMSGLMEEKKGPTRGRRQPTSGDSNVVKIIRTIKERDMLPCIIFSFSRKECEAYAISLKEMDFNTEEEKKQIKEIYINAIEMLSDEDRKLPQINQLLPLLQRGIGVHHSGLLPILKEVIEILFGESLIKTLFATETFSMGLNMPARTVLFTSAQKYDGKNHRFLTSGEYIQMSGRAGRRGLDSKGLVILMVDAKMTSDDAKQIIKGATDPLNSQFRLTYNMILNLIRVDGWNPESMLERSFYQFQNQDSIPKLREQIKDKTDEVRNMEVPYESELRAYRNIDNQITAHSKTVTKFIRKPGVIVPFLHSGRLLYIIAGTRDFGWGALVNFSRKTNPDDSSQVIYVIDVLVAVDLDSLDADKNPSTLKPAAKGFPPTYEVVPMTLECINKVSAIRVKLPENLNKNSYRDLGGKMIEKVHKQFANGNVPELDPKEDMGVNDEELVHAVEKKKLLAERKANHELTKRSDFSEILARFDRKEEANRELQALRDELNKIMSIQKLEELEHRKRVLRRLAYVDQSEIITAKGQVACEISASDELMLTEMLYGDVFSKLSTEHLVALISCFVFQENAQTPKLADELSGCLRSLHEFARRIAKVSNECKVEIIEEQYVESFKPGLMDVVHQWASGMSFGEIMKTTDVFEGSIIRCLRRLEEVLRELTAAAKGMQNQELEQKLDNARALIKRDIVFAASLYL